MNNQFSDVKKVLDELYPRREHDPVMRRGPQGMRGRPNAGNKPANVKEMAEFGFGKTSGPPKFSGHVKTTVIEKTDEDGFETSELETEKPAETEGSNPDVVISTDSHGVVTQETTITGRTRGGTKSRGPPTRGRGHGGRGGRGGYDN